MRKPDTEIWFLNVICKYVQNILFEFTIKWDLSSDLPPMLDMHHQLLTKITWFSSLNDQPLREYNYVKISDRVVRNGTN